MLSREDFTIERINRYSEENKSDPTFEVLMPEERTKNRRRFLEKLTSGDDLWVFGYGSLVWNPAFDFIEQAKARLFGFHRSFCLHLTIGRGRPDNPGLMLALDNGGSCNGVAFKIDSTRIESETEILWNREMITGAYRPHLGRVKIETQIEPCLVFVINRNNPRYIGKMSLKQQASFIASAEGDIGSCSEYLNNTVCDLAKLDISDRYLTDLKTLVDEIKSQRKTA